MDDVPDLGAIVKATYTKEMFGSDEITPLLTLELRLGEGTGALAAVPLVRLAAVGVVDVATFQEWGLA